MIAKIIPVLTGVLAAFCISSAAYAIDQLPLPNPSVTTVSAEVKQFVRNTSQSASSAEVCANILKENTSERIRVIKEYRQCRADHALAQLAVWRWQDNTLN